MPVTVLLPNALRPYAALNDRVALEASTVEETLIQLVARFPDLAGRLPSPDQPAPGCGVFCGGMDVRRLQGSATPLGHNDKLTIIVPSGDL
ncbi:MAG: hypothetical protein NVSMB42_19160 [Herpetosiphon sp.]